MKEASRLRREREVQRAASGPMLVTPWRRREPAPCLEWQSMMACSNVSGSRPQRGQVVLALGDLYVGWVAR